MKNLKLLTVINLAALLVMNIAFYFVFRGRVASHLYDGAGIASLVVVAVTFIPLFRKSGIWKLTHAKADKLDERELALTHWALSESYGWFAVICLVIMLVFSFTGRMNICPQFTISMPLVASLIYLSHVLPGVMIAWKHGIQEQSE
ncbi:MAG: hypothetical protein J7K88_05900 [Candidatus Fermentibacteraceae bacterium]|nr:hypothetical protein [Candidatus Fermentibacteraceae bacterium]